MNTVNLKLLKKYQEIPKVNIIPLLVTSKNIYYTKLISNIKEEQWIDGIFSYEKETKKIQRLDIGKHIENVKKSEMYIPLTKGDAILNKKLNMLSYSTTKQLDENKKAIHINAIDIKTGEQFELYKIKYDGNDFVYGGFKILSNTYLMIKLLNSLRPEIKELDRYFIVNMLNKEIMEIKDSYFKYSIGEIFMSPNSENFFLEEYYTFEDDECEITTSPNFKYDYEDDLKKGYIDPFYNSIKVLPFEVLEMYISRNTKKIPFKTLDSMNYQGILRIIGITSKYAYYKKTKHSKYLDVKHNFLDRILEGKEEIFSIDLKSLDIKKVATLEDYTALSYEDDHLYKIYEEPNSLRIQRVETGNFLFEMERPKFLKYENFAKKRYLIFQNFENINKPFYEVYDIIKNKTLLKAEEIRYLFGTFFYENKII